MEFVFLRIFYLLCLKGLHFYISVWLNNNCYLGYYTIQLRNIIQFNAFNSSFSNFIRCFLLTYVNVSILTLTYHKIWKTKCAFYQPIRILFKDVQHRVTGMRKTVVPKITITLRCSALLKTFWKPTTQFVYLNS